MPPLRITSVPIPRLFAPRVPRPSVSLTRALSSYSHLLRRPTTCLRITHPHPQSRTLHPNFQLTTRTLATTSTGYSQGDEIVEELQDLYETAKDEFEIATESTDGSTIYAASDRESARDALDQLLTVYSLYTTDIASTASANDPEPDDQSQVVETAFDPAAIPTEVREEVKRRVGQRVRELRNAIEVLEERAKAD
ncbi:hypothetical protein FE257_010088 [Aspergillus nanangensis]|uniref:Uncharacterized protein n=1 Tax=Aspergillus nanangensis TaxID=2582783 RepID=A0AAD4CJ85_ASPNN|nr:hypothetical protein FE257_010088 [Aspergillus nanangensis]